MANKVQLTIGGQDIYPITDASLVAGLTEAIEEAAPNIIDVSNGLTAAIKQKVTNAPSSLLLYNDFIYVPQYASDGDLPYYYNCFEGDSDDGDFHYLVIDWTNLTIDAQIVTYATQEYADSAKTFWANYGRTSYSAITAATDAGKTVCCKYAPTGRIYYLISDGVLSGNSSHVFACIDKTDTPATAYFLSVNTSNTWSNSSVTLQDKLIGSGTGQNIKTVNNNSLVGSGNVSVGTVTSVGVSNGGGLSVSGSPVTSSGTITIGHSNSVTAQNTQALYPIKIDAQGHISSYGSAVTSMTPTSHASTSTTYGVGTTANYGHVKTQTGDMNGTSSTDGIAAGLGHTHSQYAPLASPALTGTPTAPTATSGTNTTQIATTAFVKTAIDNLPEPMIFKGSLGTGGTITSLPAASSSNEGYTYKVITAGTYASQAAKVGDTFISTGSEWVLIPSGDEPSGTVTSIAISATSPIAIDSSAAITTSGTRTISHANSGVTAGTYKSVTVNATGHVTAGSNPTTLSGYGITDAKIASGTITLGSNTITPVTGPASSTANHIATFSDATGKVIKDSGYTIATSVPSGAVFTDTKVTQSQTTANETYGVLLKNTTGNTDETNPVKYSSGLIFNPSTTRLGIGTTSPISALDVRGDICIGPPGSYGTIGTPYGTGDTARYNKIVFNSSNSNGDIVYDAGKWTSGDHIAHKFEVANQGAALVIRNITGNVGIGTDTPGYKLHVNGPSYSSAGTIAATYLQSLAGDVYVGNTSGSRCHQQYDSTNKCLKFIFD